MPRKIAVEIVGDSRSLERAFRRSERSATRFERSIRGVSRGIKAGFAAFGVGLGVDVLAHGLSDAVKAASDLHEEVTKTNVVFRRSAHEVEAWSRTTADAFGISDEEALKAASNFGLLFNTFTKGSDQSAQMSQRLVELAGDLASFFNVATSDALEKLRSGLAGQARPLRVFGVFLSDSAVKAEAYRSGIARVGSELTAAQKIQARYNIILRQTRPAQGDMARTAGSWANVQRRLGALLTNTAAKIGQSLLPMLKKYGGALAKWLADEKNQKKLARDVAGVMDALAKSVTGVADAYLYLHDKANDVSNWFDKHGLGFMNKGALQDIKDLRNWMRGTGGGGGLTNAQLAAQMRSPTLPRGFGVGNLPPGMGGWATYMGGGLISGDQGGKHGPTAKQIERIKELRNQFFDARITRQLDRVQDLGLRAQVARLRQIAAEVRARLAGTKDTQRRLTLEDQLLQIYRQQKDVQSQITDQIKQANQALKDRADAIKQAVLDRLDRRRTDIENKRALQDANEALRIARQLGGAKGIQAARRQRTDVLLNMLQARVERQPARLTRGGVFSLGNVITINIHGITDPDKVAKAVVAAINRRGRHTTTQTRGPAAGATAGAH